MLGGQGIVRRGPSRQLTKARGFLPGGRISATIRLKVMLRRGGGGLFHAGRRDPEDQIARLLTGLFEAMMSTFRCQREPA